MLKNDFYGKTAAVNGDENSIKRIVAAAEVSLAASAGSLAGTVQIDSDFSNSLTPSDPFWPASSKTLTLTSAEGSSATDVAADGAFFFETIAPGDYVASVSGGGWSLVLPATITVVKGEVHTDAKILFQESLKPLLLKPDTGSTSAGASTVVDVKKNDSWFTAAAPAPQTAASIQPGGEAAYGTATLTADGSLSYTSAAEWPAAFAGQPSYEDVVTYTVTDSAGATATTVVTITVYAAPVAVDDAVTIAASGSHNVDALGNDSGHKLELGDAPTTADDLHATSAQGKVSIASAHVWADGEATYDAVVTYSVVDAFGQPATANIAVTVQRAPVVTVEAGQTVPADGAAVFEPQLLNPAVVDPSDITVSTKPRQGAVSVAADGAITFTPGDAKPGEYTFTVTYTDDLGQSTTQDFTVTVYEVLAAADDTATLPWVRGSEIDVLSNDAGDDVTITTATSTGPDAGTVEIRDGKLFFTPSTEREWAVDELSYVETLEYGIIDAHGTAAAATVTLTIVKPPVGKDLHVDLASDVELVTFDPIGEATGTNIQRLSADAVIAKPANGKASIVDGVLTYAPNDGFAGDDTFTVRIEDALGQIGEVTYTVTVAAADIPETKLPETGGDNGGTGGGDAGTSGGNGGGVSTQAPHTVAGLAVTGTNESAWLLGLVLLAAGAVFGALASTSGSRRRLVKGSSHES
nr:Ig-like domain-containing protein [Lysinibacter cavernae]